MSRFDDSRTMLEAALMYAEEFGWSVLPLHTPAAGGCSCGKPKCTSRGKHPRTIHGVSDATTDVEQIRRWWAQWPDANVGVATGSISEIVAVDIDGPKGEEAFTNLCGNPPSLSSKTGKGRHVIFAAPQIPIKNAVRLAPKLDIRGDGGYIVAPPSRHASGHQYRWEDELGLGPQQITPAPIPSSLLRAITTSPARRRHGAIDLTTIARVGEGHRNDGFLTPYAGRLLGMGHSESETLELCLALNTEKCDPPLPREEVVRIVQSIARREASKRGVELTPHPRPWPEPPSLEAFRGLPGEIVGLIAPHSEADEVALLVQFLVAFGNALNRGPHFIVEADYHPMNLFVILIGSTAKGRKGSSWGQFRRVLDRADQEWCRHRIRSGLSSGEGLIWQVRDQIEKQQRIKGNGAVAYETIVDDPGVEDKRLLVFEPEFASTLRVMRRKDNILSAVVRQAWDTGELRTLTKNTPAQATDAHISIVAHITAPELVRLLDRTDIANGFLNRFLPVCVQRSKYLPRGGDLHEESLEVPTRKVRDALDFGRKTQCLKFDDASWGLWEQRYQDLSTAKPGLLGAVTSRAEAQVRRLACLYAILDRSSVVKQVHLAAALALWNYVEASALFVFGDALGDPTADELLQAIRAAPKGLTQTAIRDFFSRHGGQAAKVALDSLSGFGLVVQKVDPPSGGRPATRWVATEATKLEKGSPEALSSLRSQAARQQGEPVGGAHG